MNNKTHLLSLQWIFMDIAIFWHKLLYNKYINKNPSIYNRMVLQYRYIDEDTNMEFENVHWKFSF